MKWPRTGTAQRSHDPAASMALLEEVLDPPVGPGYSSAALARQEAGLTPSAGFNTPLMLVVATLLGLLLTVAAISLRTPTPDAAEARNELISRIEAAQTAGDEQRALVEQLRGDIAALEQDHAVTGAGTSQGSDIAAAGLLAGAQALTGPGVTVTLTDAPPSQAAPGDDTEAARVNARDLQLVSNALWGAGAEAISINGHRLTSTSAIRFAGEAVIVDFRGLTPPYVVVAIGDPVLLEAETRDGVVGAYLAELRRQLGIGSTVEASDALVVGPAERLTTRVGVVPAEPAKESS